MYFVLFRKRQAEKTHDISVPIKGRKIDVMSLAIPERLQFRQKALKLAQNADVFNALSIYYERGQKKFMELFRDTWYSSRWEMFTDQFFKEVVNEFKIRHSRNTIIGDETSQRCIYCSNRIHHSCECDLAFINRGHSVETELWEIAMELYVKVPSFNVKYA